MTEQVQPTYEELAGRLAAAESALHALRDGQIDTILGERETLVVRLAEAEYREAHIRNVLEAVRNVDQLLVKESDPKRLIEGACQNLTETLGYLSAWITLVDGPAGSKMSAAISGFGSGFADAADEFSQGRYTACMMRALEQDEVVLVEDSLSQCPDCPLSCVCAGRAGLARRLTHEDRIYGVLFVSTPRPYAHDPEEQALFNEVADDLSFALRRIEADEQLRRLHTIVTTIPHPMALIDREYRYQAVNDVYTELFGVDRESILGHEVAEFAGGELFEREVRPRLDQCLAGQTVRYQAHVDLPGRGWRWIELDYFPYRDDAGRVSAVVSHWRDITERKRSENERARLEEQYRQAQKMEAVGRLAGGVAHDFNNMLSVILGNVEMILGDAPPNSALSGHLWEVRKAAERSADLTRQLLAFARKQTVSPMVLDLNETVSGMLTMLHRLIGEDIDLSWKPGAGVGAVRMDPGQINQLLANLCVNARDAIDGVGKVTISTENAHLDDIRRDDAPNVIAGDYVRLIVSDDGCGMDDETLTHLFEPFFTTKAAGEGTGLGLATVYGIVKQNGGFIDVDSEPDAGSTFTVYLPRESEAKVDRPQRHAERASEGSETVLFVEDEPAILKLGKAMLESLGYCVLAAATPGEAFAAADEHAGEIDLLLTDVVMPEMNGRELASKMMAANPSLKRLFMSGYTADVIANRGVLDEGVHFIQKPFTKKELAEKIREALADG